LSDFQRGRIVGARLAGASVTKMATLLGVSRAAVLNVMTSYTHRGKSSTAERNIGRKPKPGERDCSALNWIVSKNYGNAAAKVTAELNIRREDMFPPKTVRRELHRSNIHGRAETAKPLITESNGKRRKRWCDDHETCTSDNWKYIVRPDGSSFMLFLASGRAYFRRTPKKNYRPECLVQTVKHGARSMVSWAAISWYSVGPLIFLIGRITACDYVDIIGDQVHPMIQRLFPKNVAFFFNMTFRPYTSRVFLHSCDRAS
jgi:hypothetical protein